MPADTLSLAGKTASVTGSGRETGIGAGISGALARDGASVAIHYVSEDSKARAEKAASNINKEFGTNITVVQGGMENYDSAKSMVEQILQAFSVDYTDIFVNNAAVARNTPLLKVKQEQLEHEFAVNVFGVECLKGAASSASSASSTSSPSPRKFWVHLLLYSATTAAMDALKMLWDRELGKSHRISVNTLAPDPVPTDLSKEYMVNPDGCPIALLVSMYAKIRAVNRIGTVEDLADATLLLVSEKSLWITVQLISVSGGITGTV
ncbi:putative short-chain dehydrogenase [Clohesyomyces aquaticus]|uniref:Putative short-chain dehydrogenase n=1 Tax=Clohesyomyces aquaticus TaxID=1231657 RepID=A0A1Y2AB36_9PLEO|nr:putative short-chain dehydrogenase [Clohesyomyces aquaticus]